ncbi:MAG: prepilin-type N-terminal cleavage/methylation domain-containing protein [Deltaproteobacteria bacterium]|nr:prepilin-type N-terminal cleavage/methylation domain-containing protein [Deltaproteobacteria bacterium]
MIRDKLGREGFTLVELVFVIAIIVVLAGILIPLALNKLGEADQARADADLQGMASALTTFYTDNRHFPACHATDCDPLNGTTNGLKILVFKSDGTDVTTTDIPPTDTASACSVAWNAATNLVSANADQNNAFNHLIINNPNGDSITGGSGVDYRKWKGPYVGKMGKDPYGNYYVAHIGAIEKGGSKINSAGTGYGWVLSAGIDGVFQTCPESTSLAGDDTGFIFVSQ